MHLIWTVLIGLSAGLLAKLLSPGREPGGFLVVAAVGIAGSLAATYVGHALGWYQAGQKAGFAGGVGGAVMLLLAYQLVSRR